MRSGKQCILIADDDPQIREMLQLLLTSADYTPVVAEDGLQAVQLATQNVDLYLLDVSMPGQSGLMAAAQIREQFHAPIIFLTAYSSESDKVMGFSVGADDYIVKPFSNAELLLRLKAVLRRTGNSSSIPHSHNKLMIQDLTLEPDNQTVFKGDETVNLTYTEYKILELLAMNRKKIFSLENIYQSIWNDNAVGNEAIMAHIKNIRKKLGDSAKNPTYIKTAWGKGYYID